MSLGSVLNTAKQAILSNLTAINVTGSNIANVNTPGYTRLNPVFNAVGTNSTSSSGREQVGVEISEIKRVYDKYLETQIVTQNSAVGSATARNDLLTQIEGVLNESTGSGVSDALSKFWSAWDDLSANPSGESERSILVSAAQNLSYVFNQRAEELYTLQYNTDETIAGDVEKLNGYLNDMSALNTEIVRIESSGGSASALRDSRSILLSNISSIIDINYVEQDDGALYVYLPENGKTLVEGSKNWQLTVQPNSSNSNLNDIVFTDDTANPLNNYIQGGELGGLLDIRDVTLPAYIDKLNQTASSIVNKVNAQHMAGYDQDGNIGGLFFDKTTEAKDMAVNAAIVADSRMIAASSTLNADGDNATAMTAIKDDKMYASLGTISFTGGSSAVGQINNIGQAYKDTLQTLIGSIANTAGGASPIKATDAWSTITSATVSVNDSFTITGKKHDGTEISGSFTINNTADTVQDLLDYINTLYGASVASIDSEGKLKIQDTIAGDSSFSFNITKSSSNSGTLDFGTISSTGGILLTLGATGWTVTDNGGYSEMPKGSSVLSADAKTITIDLNGDKTADITLNLSGTWNSGDTISFSLSKQDSTTTIGGYYSAFMARVGQNTANSTLTLEREQTIATQNSAQREELSGVSLDEEMLNLIKYQMAYNAAGRVTGIVSELMDTLIALGK
ncbi:MAG: flagellar hook-associated protein FlgK [Smithella sp.]